MVKKKPTDTMDDEFIFNKVSGSFISVLGFVVMLLVTNKLTITGNIIGSQKTQGILAILWGGLLIITGLWMVFKRK